MDFWPADLNRFLWVIALGVLALIFKELIKKFSEDAYRYLKSKWFPGPPEPVKVDGKFVATAFEPAKCAWIPEGESYDYETKNYFYYPHPKTKGKCFRVVGAGSISKEFLMVSPDAKKVGTF